MVIETELLPFHLWIRSAPLDWLKVAGALALAFLLVGYLVAALRHGPVVALEVTGKTLVGWLEDLVFLSPRRLWALMWLSIRDALRRRIVVVFALFLVVLMFAGWFLDPGNDHPVRLYLSFVLTATSYLTLLLVLFLSVFSIPGDLRSKTLHTVVTKPVRPSEVVLGRMLGFIAIGTFLLLVMGAISYVFVVRGLAHTHEVLPRALATLEGPAGAPADAATLVGKSEPAHNHRHDVVIHAQGHGRLETARGHRHRVVRQGEGKDATYVVGEPEGMFVARVPLYGKLRFVDRDRRAAEKGINVGDEWAYRSYVEGGTLGAAIWTFSGIVPERFPDKLPLEMTISVYRSEKGVITEGIPGVLLLRNPKTGLTVEAKVFTAREFSTDVQIIQRKITPNNVYALKEEKLEDGKLRYVREDLAAGQAVKERYDLFEDLTNEGRIEIWMQCLAPRQYLGAAQADLYLRASDAPFWWNFTKGYLGIWMQMVLLVAFGVTLSTFLGGPVALIAAVGVLVGGLFREFMVQVATGTVYSAKPGDVNMGGGPIESMIRMATQQNVVTDMPEGLRTTVAQTIDPVLERGLWLMAQILPDLGRFSAADYVAYGFNVSGDWLCEGGLATLGFFVLLSLASCLFMRIREVAK
ncbi:MAG: hypothetical protein JW809_03600 [Pirellulales bacterium]|nr:hypothetical protein [Pirellulales bacterium]